MLPDFLASSQAGNSELLPAGPVHVDLAFTAVNQLWEEVSRIIKTVNSVMVPFLKLYGVEEGHGLSPFASGIDSPSDLIDKITEFFKPPKRDPRDKAPSIADVGCQDDEDEHHDNSVTQKQDDNGGILDIYVTEFVKSLLQMDIEQEESNDTALNPNTGDDGTLMGKSLPCCVI